MSSALPLTPGMARNVVNKLAPMAIRKIEALGMTPRQQELNHLWSWFSCCRYDARRVDWDGSERVERIDGEGIATAGVTPGGFYQAAADFPMKFRRPSAPYNLPRVIVNRFTGLLFSESQHPKIRCVGDDDLEDYATALADTSRLWASMIQARTFGGATGTFCVGFKFVKGKPTIEVHDPRWVTPKFKNWETMELESIDKRWMWPKYVQDAKGEWEELWFWTRRIIDEQVDVVWNEVPVDPSGGEPNWAAYPPDQAVNHGFDECPVIWGQNIPVCDAEDGEPDCLGVFDMVEEMDALIAQSGMSTKRNLDPTVIINSNKLLGELQKGSQNAIKLEVGGGANYLEMEGSGQKQAMEQALQLRTFVLEVSQCVLDHPGSDGAANKTATEIRMVYASMMSKADVLREQYGQKCVLPIVEKMLRAVRKLGTAKLGAAPNGGPLRQAIMLPPREITDDAGNKSYKPRTLPEESDQTGVFTLHWPPYFPPSLQDAQQAALAIKEAKDAAAVSQETTTAFLAPYFGVDDVPAELQKVKSEAKQLEADAKADAMQAWGKQ